MIRILFLPVVLFFFLVAVCSGYSDREGGFVVGYTPQEKISDAKKYSEDETLNNYVVDDKQETASSDVSLSSFKKQLSLKDAKITLLEKRLEQAEKKIKEREAELYAVSPLKNKVYEVKKGDSLWKIAKKREIYGNPYMWIKIYNANMKKIQNAGIIYPGQLFDIPK